MKKIAIAISIFFLFGFFVMTSQTVESRDSGNNTQADQVISTTIFSAQDFDKPPGIYIIQKHNLYYLQVRKQIPSASISRTFNGETAQYNLTVSYLDWFLKEPSINVLINDQKVGTIEFHKPDDGSKDLFTTRERTLHGLNIQKWSKITFEINNEPMKEGYDRLHMEKFVFAPVGSFQGKISDLRNPEPLRIYESLDEQHKSRDMMSTFVERSLAPLKEKRAEDLKRLTRPADWQERHNNIKACLSEYFGEFPEKKPLNARIVGTIERDKYIIEKVIFESQPNYYCAANFYIPKDRPYPVPGVLITIGHKELGKSRPMYHELGLGLALKGYAALALEPMGQGERSEYFDPETKTHFLERKTDQHHYFGRQAFLAEWSLASSRTWDCIRAVDYLVSRTEVDTSKLAVVGNSGGGEMAMFITAVDQRIKVCAAGHPGGSCESMLLNGMSLSVQDIYSLVPPRPCRIIVGRESREAPGHMGTIDYLRPFYDGLNAPEEALEMSIVGGLHDIKKPKRESVYEWFNKWFDKVDGNSTEPPLQPEKMESLWCAESGFTLISFGGETAQSISAKRAARIYKPKKDLVKLKERVAKRIGLNNFDKSNSIVVKPAGDFSNAKMSVEKLIIDSEKGVELPVLVMKPAHFDSKNSLILHVSDQGKPTEIENPSIPLTLVGEGFIVLSIDVRGIGETAPSPPVTFTKYTGRPEMQWRRDQLAINSLSLKRTILGMRTFDVLTVIQYIKSRDDLNTKPIVVVGEGLGGIWALLAASYNSDVDRVVCIGTLPSYKLLVNSHYYNVWNYFWVPGALRDYDIPDLSRLMAPRMQLWINPVNALAEPLEEKEFSSILTNQKDYQFVRTMDTSPVNLTKEIIKFLQ